MLVVDRTFRVVLLFSLRMCRRMTIGMHMCLYGDVPDVLETMILAVMGMGSRVNTAQLDRKCAQSRLGATKNVDQRTSEF